MTTLFVQSGVFNDRSRAIRIETQSIINKLNLQEQKVEIITSGLTNELATKDHKDIIIHAKIREWFRQY